MPRRNKPRDSGRVGRPAAAGPRHPAPVGAWQVQRIAGADAVKPYRCPGCEGIVPVGTAHVVVWAAASDGSDRRHWHTGCWTARERRPPPGTPRR